MATLTNTQISVTYVGLLKTSANTVLTSTAQQITDGSGNNSIMFLSTAGVGIGGSPASGKELDVTGNVQVTGDLIVDNITIDGSTITNASGDLTIVNTTDDADIIFQSDDASGGVTTYFKLDGSAGFTVVSKKFRFEDNVNLTLGTADDLSLFHDGTDSTIKNDTGDLIIKNNADDKDIIFQSDDGSGGVETYFKLDGGDSSSNPLTLFPDNARAGFGASADLIIYHDGSNSFINEQGTGDLYIQTNGTNMFLRDSASGNTFIAMNTGTADVSLKQGGNTKFETTSTGITITGVAVTDGLDLGDNEKIRLGASQDLQIYHDGSHSYIQDTGTGDLKLQASNDIFLLDGSGNVMIEASEGGSVDLFHNGSKRFETTSSGVTVSGTITANSDSDQILNLNSSDSNAVYLAFQRGGSRKAYIGYGGSGNTFNIVNEISDGDISIVGNDGGVTTPVLSFDVSDSGAATFAGNVAVGDGSVSSPSITFSGDTDTGIFRTASNAINFGTNGAERMRLTNTGLGIGTTSPGGNLHVVGASGGAGQIYISDADNGTGTSDALLISKSGTNAFIYNRDSGNISFGTNDVSSILTLDNSQNATFAGNISLADSKNLKLGTGQDLELFHSGTESFISNATGHLTIQNSADDKDIIFKSDDGSGGTATYFFLDGSEVRTTFNKEARFIDSAKLKLGDSGDLQIFHDGTDTHLENATGTLNIEANNLRLGSYGTDDYIIATNAGSVELYHNDVKKFETTSAGVTVTGNITVSSGVAIFNDGNGINFGNSDAKIYGSTANGIQFNASGSEAMRLDQSGNLFVGATTTISTGNGFSVSSTGQVRIGRASTGVIKQIVFSNPNDEVGSISTSGSATAFNTSSDYRLKEDLQDFTGLDMISKIPVYDFKWKSDKSRSYGVMAHELEEVLPQAVTGEKDAEQMQSVDYSKIVPLLIKSIQELKKEIEILKLDKNGKK